MHSRNEADRDEPDSGSGERPLTRAGLRRVPIDPEPTGVFVVIEMTVLVLVIALTMVSIIVSVDEVDGPGRSSQASGHVDTGRTRASDAADVHDASPRDVDGRWSQADVATR